MLRFVEALTQKKGLKKNTVVMWGSVVLTVARVPVYFKDEAQTALFKDPVPTAQ